MQRVWRFDGAPATSDHGAHPGPAGYQEYFEAVRDPLMHFLTMP